ncbi:hypothetical protein LCDVSa105L [Lymphocystis disease virus 3]|uniref:Uncharacterized protein n=1 Tax=Lymphocystis disease virus 3 TaxID=2560566 RepID=A0A1B2RW14_9VIRU|nr:hypothetical protein BZK12_gp105 [Lymphocystis disease virus Sa]AOC55189.1 hypothetical protein LCDVSa105L [Lymphocystis disease virus 3]
MRLFNIIKLNLLSFLMFQRRYFIFKSFIASDDDAFWS